MEIVCPAWIPGIKRLIDAIPILADQGVTAIEIGNHYPHDFNSNDPEEIRELIDQIKTCGIRIHSIHAPFGEFFDISSLNDNIHERGVTSLIETIELAGLLNANCIIVHASNIVEDNRKRRFDRACGVIREISNIARDSGIMLALENLPSQYLGYTTEELFIMLGSAAKDSTGICFDSGHANLTDNFYKYANLLLPWAITTHLHDNNGIEDQHLFPGKGTIDWRKFYKQYRESKCGATIMLECLPNDNMPWSAAFQEFRATLSH